MKRRFMMRDGKIMAVLRPQDPALAMKMADDCVEADRKGTRTPEESESAFAAILHAQPYTYVGIAEHPQHKSTSLPRLLDRDSREPIGHMQPGDSFASLEQVEEAFAMQQHGEEASKIVAEALADASGKSPQKP